MIILCFSSLGDVAPVLILPEIVSGTGGTDLLGQLDFTWPELGIVHIPKMYRTTLMYSTHFAPLTH